MVKMPDTPRSGCPINFGLEIFGDRWSILILRDILLVGKRTFGEFQASEEAISSNILADRLARLERSGLISRHKVATDARQLHYTPTDAGKRLLPVLGDGLLGGNTRYKDGFSGLIPRGI
jgi:DNA-binding HxlR family transcriptional regulator